jgi:hypothetical protein
MVSGASGTDHGHRDRPALTGRAAAGSSFSRSSSGHAPDGDPGAVIIGILRLRLRVFPESPTCHSVQDDRGVLEPVYYYFKESAIVVFFLSRLHGGRQEARQVRIVWPSWGPATFGNLFSTPSGNTRNIPARPVDQARPGSRCAPLLRGAGDRDRSVVMREQRRGAHRPGRQPPCADLPSDRRGLALFSLPPGLEVGLVRLSSRNASRSSSCFSACIPGHTPSAHPSFLGSDPRG